VFWGKADDGEGEWQADGAPEDGNTGIVSSRRGNVVEGISKASRGDNLTGEQDQGSESRDELAPLGTPKAGQAVAKRVTLDSHESPGADEAVRTADAGARTGGVGRGEWCVQRFYIA